jgi:acyl carrier protein
MTNQLIELVSDIINIPANDLTMDSGPANQPAWDSLAHVTIVSAVEETYGINLTMPEILGIKTIHDLENAIDLHRK